VSMAKGGSAMDFEVGFSPDLEGFRNEVNAWLDANAPALVQSSDPRDITDEQRAKQDVFRQALGHQGWLYPTGNPRYGGGGLSVDHAVVIHQELERRGVLVGSNLGARTAVAGMQKYGSEEQKNHWLPLFMKGDADSMQLLTEPQGGSDLASAKTTAILDGDDYVVNGQKIFVGGDERPTYGTAIVMTDPQGARHNNLSYLLIPLRAPGVTIQPLYLLHSSPPAGHSNIVFFDDVRIPVFNRIGVHNQGWAVAALNMEMEHGGSGNISENRNLSRLVQSLKEIQWDGKALIEDTDVRDILGETLQEREIQRLFGLRNYWLSRSKAGSGHEGPQLSYWNKTRAHSFASQMMDLLGQFALARDPQYVTAEGYLEQYQRSVFAAVHAAGGLNIQATIVARRLGVGRNTREESPVIDSPAG
jgi:alkylation response protein AidB-like acyl-CoA dehydrogenase